MADSGFVYLWFDRKHRRFYVGSHWGSPRDGYVCSSSWMLRARRRRPHDFKRKILATVTTTRADLLKEEERWLAMIKPSEIKIRYYNIKSKGTNIWAANPGSRITVGQKIAAALKGRPPAHGHNEAVRKAISVGRLAAYERARLETGSAINEKTRKALDPTGRCHPEAYKKRHGTKMKKVRAKNPDWDRVHDRVCLGCGKKFVGRKMQDWCCSQCYFRVRYLSRNGHRNKTIEKTCAHCGQPFKTKRPPQKFCSRKCGYTFEHRKNGRARYHARAEKAASVSP